MGEAADIAQKYEAILAKAGIGAKVTGVEVKLQPGRHYSSSCSCDTLQLDDGTKKEFFRKAKPTNPPHLKMANEWRMYQRESGFYNVLVPDLLSYVDKLPAA
jgi:hypothetical protein